MKHYSKILSPPKHSKDVTTPSKVDIDTEIAHIGTFIKTGLFTLSIILLSGIAIVQSQKNMENQSNPSTASNVIHNKKLPIYCVDRKDKVVALSFDAAWGARRLLESFQFIKIQQKEVIGRE